MLVLLCWFVGKMGWFEATVVVGRRESSYPWVEIQGGRVAGKKRVQDYLKAMQRWIRMSLSSYPAPLMTMMSHYSVKQ